MDPIYQSYYYYYSYLPILWGVRNTQPSFPYFQIQPQVLYPTFQSWINPSADLGKATAASNLRSAASKLIDVFKYRNLSVSGKGINGEVGENAPVGTYEINVSQLARPQINAGNWLNVTSYDFSPGDYTFRISVGGVERYVSVSVTSDMNNLQVLNEMASAINELGIGLRATVEISEDQARLVITGESGEENAFSIEDVTGNLVSIAGASNTVQTAQNLVYSVNGTVYENSENVIDVIPGVTLEVLEEGNYTVEVGYDVSRIREVVEEFVNAFNQALSYAQSFAAEGLAQTLLNSPLLQGIGIENIGGRLEITEGFKEALRDTMTIQTKVLPALQTASAMAQNLANMLSYQPSFSTYSLSYNNLLIQTMLGPLYSSFLDFFA